MPGTGAGEDDGAVCHPGCGRPGQTSRPRHPRLLVETNEYCLLIGQLEDFLASVWPSNTFPSHTIHWASKIHKCVTLASV